MSKYKVFFDGVHVDCTTKKEAEALAKDCRAFIACRPNSVKITTEKPTGAKKK